MSTTPSARVRPRRELALIAALGAAGVLTLSACGQDDTTTDGGATAAGGTADDSTTADDSATADAEATLVDAQGTESGTASFIESGDGMRIDAQVHGLEAGFYGFHIHGIGECEPDSAAPDDPEDTGDFLSAGGHLGGDEAEHPEHAGDLPSLLVTDAGEGWLTFTTDRVTLADLTDDDGAALMVHDGQDNFANVPERYASEGPDEDTLGTGDAGGRLACGVIETAG